VNVCTFFIERLFTLAWISQLVNEACFDRHSYIPFMSIMEC
jgi:hypothetical protein